MDILTINNNGGRHKTVTLIENGLDVVKLKLNYNIFELNNTIYMNLAGFTVDNFDTNYIKQFSKEELIYS